MNNTLSFSVPSGYRVTPDSQPFVECERGCGWKLSVKLLSDLSDVTRDQLFHYHDEWHAGK